MRRIRDVLMQRYSPPVRTRTSGTPDGGRDVWLRNNHKLRDGNIFPKTVEFDIEEDSTKIGSRKMRERTDLHPEDAGEALGKPRGFGRRDVGARTP